MLTVLQREFVYLWYYFDLQLRQIFPYWVLGMVLGSAISVFVKEHIHGLFRSLQGKRLGVLGIFAASASGFASPLCMYGTIPLAASFSESGMEDDWLVVVKISVTLPLRWQRNMPSPLSAGAGHFDRHQSEQQMAF